MTIRNTLDAAPITPSQNNMVGDGTRSRSLPVAPSPESHMTLIKNRPCYLKALRRCNSLPPACSSMPQERKQTQSIKLQLELFKTIGRFLPDPELANLSLTNKVLQNELNGAHLPEPDLNKSLQRHK